MAQLMAKEGMKKFGDRAKDAIIKEFAQLNDMDTWEGIDPTSITYQTKKEALKLITLVTEKRCGRIKGQACADGRKQRRYIAKEDAASPTVSNEGLLLTLLIDAMEGRDVATADVVGAFLKADMDEYVLVKLIGNEVDLLCATDEKYKKYIGYEKGKKVMYLKLNKALYGMMRVSLLWYETFTGSLKEMGFKLNKYNPCVANKMIEGKQCTVAWYVDDTKISHVSPRIVDSVIEAIEKQHSKMTVKRGNRHTFVGIDFEILNNGKVRILMQDYIKECIEVLGLDVSNKATTPATGDLFEVDDKSKVLEEKRVELYHHIVAKLLYVSKRARLDIQLTIAFMCTRVSKSTEQDWSKLHRLLRYLNHTIDMPRIVGASSFNLLQTWVDASYAIHNDMRGHTGGLMTLGHGVFGVESSKQKLNTKSSTETEVVGASDYLPQTIWSIWFLKDQGYNMKENKYYQDNQSAMRLEKNRMKSCGKKSRHINIRYFLLQM